jgi:hypothetical protein
MPLPHFGIGRPKEYNPGDIIRFTYEHQTVDKQTGGKFKEVLVLNPWWHNKLHGIDLQRLSPAERKVLEFLLDPEKENTPSRIPLINSIRKRMKPLKDIQNPQMFYTKFVKPFLNKKDAYRQYIPKLMKNPTKIRDAKISTGKAPVKDPLFGHAPNPAAKQQTAEPPTPLTPLDLMKQNARNKGLK